MDDETSCVLPEEIREGDVLVYMGGRLLIVDHLVPEAFVIDLVELQDDAAASRPDPVAAVSAAPQRRDDEAAEVAVVVMPRLGRLKPWCVEVGRERVVLRATELEEEATAGTGARSPRARRPDARREPVVPAVEGEHGLVLLHVGGEQAPVRGGHVRRDRGDHVDRPGCVERRGQVADHHPHAVARRARRRRQRRRRRRPRGRPAPRAGSTPPPRHHPCTGRRPCPARGSTRRGAARQLFGLGRGRRTHPAQRAARDHRSGRVR